VRPVLGRPLKYPAHRIGEKIYCGNARRHPPQHRLHLTRIGPLQPEVREQHNHVVNLDTPTARPTKRCAAALQHEIATQHATDLVEIAVRRASMRAGEALSARPPRRVGSIGPGVARLTLCTRCRTCRSNMCGFHYRLLSVIDVSIGDGAVRDIALVDDRPISTGDGDRLIFPKTTPCKVG
jgi:hypothetical protein